MACGKCKKAKCQCPAQTSEEKLLEKLDARITALFKENQDSFSNLIEAAVAAATTSLTEEIRQLREANEEMHARLLALEKRETPQPQQQPYGAPPEGLFKGATFQMAVAKALGDNAEREKKKSNLVIVGLAEPLPGLTDEPTPSDLEQVRQLAADLSIDPTKIERVFRHGQSNDNGRPRITKVVFGCLDTRRRFLSGLRPLLLQRLGEGQTRTPFYVRPDLTRDELAEQAELNHRRLAMIREGQDVVIYRGKIMPRQERDGLRKSN